MVVVFLKMRMKSEVRLLLISGSEGDGKQVCGVLIDKGWRMFFRIRFSGFFTQIGRGLKAKTEALNVDKSMNALELSI